MFMYIYMNHFAIQQKSTQHCKSANTSINFSDFPDGTVDKNLPANGGDTGSIPDVGRFYMPQSI